MNVKQKIVGLFCKMEDSQLLSSKSVSPYSFRVAGVFNELLGRPDVLLDGVRL